MASLRQYDPDPSAEDENAKDRPKDDPVVDLFPDDDADDRNSKCRWIPYVAQELISSNN